VGKVVYATALEVNGGRGNLTVVSTDADPRRTLDRIRSASDAGSQMRRLFAAPDMGMATVAGRDRRLRVLALAPPFSDRCLVFLFEQSAADAQTADRPPVRHRLTDVPVYAGSTPLAFFRNDDTRTAIETSAVNPADGPAVLNFFESELTRAGWRPLLPSSVSGAPRCLMFGKAGDICIVAVRESAPPADTRITVLHKRAYRE
jgi:hypothetical protein